MGEEFRKNLAEQLRALPKDVRKSALNDARKDVRYWQGREEYLRNKSDEIEEGQDILVKKKILYYGADKPGIKEIRKAENTSVGNGVYLTPEPLAAAGYAKTHGEWSILVPTIYEVVIENVRLANLRTREQSSVFLSGVRPQVVEALQSLPENSPWYNSAALRTALEEIDIWCKGEMSKRGTFPMITEPELFTDYMKSLGYDGLVTYEFEPTPGNHETYLIFDPQKIKIKQEQIVS